MASARMLDVSNSALPVRNLGARGSRSDLMADAGSADEQSAALAQLLGGVPGWWADRACSAGLSGKWLDVEQAVLAPMPFEATGEAPALIGTAEQVGEAYVSALSSAERAQHGRHYTPPALARELWVMTRRAMGWSKPRPLPGLVRDPACGAGALLLPALREHLGATARTDPQMALAGLPNVIAGVDTDERAVWLTNVLLAAEMLPILAITPRARRRALPALAHVGDGLALPDVPARVTIMNPPYGRVRLGEAERSRFAESLYGHANLYGLFMAAALESIDEDGVLAALVPTSFLAGRYFENLRLVLAGKAPLREIEFVADRAGSFPGVLQETCLATFTRRKARKVSIGSINGHIEHLAKVDSPRRSGPWLLPRRADDAPTAAAAIAMTQTLESAGWRVSTGPLVWNRRRTDLAAEPAAGRVPVVWAADIDGGKVHRDRSRDQQRFITLRGNDEQVMVLREPAILIQRTTAPEQSRRLVVAELTEQILQEWGGRIVVENHVNVLRPHSPNPLLGRSSLTQVLATEPLDRVMRSLSGSVALSAYELAAVPLPDEDVLDTWDQLTEGDLSAAVAAAYRPRIL